MLVKPVCYNNNYLELAKKHSSLEGLDGHMKKKKQDQNVSLQGKHNSVRKSSRASAVIFSYDCFM